MSKIRAYERQYCLHYGISLFLLLLQVFIIFYFRMHYQQQAHAMIIQLIFLYQHKYRKNFNVGECILINQVYFKQQKSKMGYTYSIMAKKLVLLALLVASIYSLNNLIVDGGFQSFNSSLTQQFTNGTEAFSYDIIPNGQTNWYSLLSGGILIRQKRDFNSIVMDTVNNNWNQKICQDFHLTDSRPYELTFDYFVDFNCNMAQLSVTLNSQQVFSTTVINKWINTATFIVFLNLPTNTLCFQGSRGGSQSLKIGVLIDNIVLAPIDVRYITFKPSIVTQQLNQILLVSNETVYDQNELLIFKSQYTIDIPGVEYSVLSVQEIESSKLAIRIQFHSQYASQTSKPVISLPSHRSHLGELILYFVSCQNLPKWMYSSQSQDQIVKQSSFYLLLFAKIFNVCYRVIKVIAFTFVALKWASGFYLLLFFCFLQIQFILPVARNLINEIAILTLSTQTVNFFIQLIGYQPFGYGSNLITEQYFPNEQVSWLSLNKAKLSPSLYSIIVDNLIIAVFNTLKLMILYSLAKKSKNMQKIVQAIVNNKILLEYVVIFSIPVLSICGCWSLGIQLTNWSHKLLRSFSNLLPFLSLGFITLHFLSQWNQLKHQYRINLHKNKNKKISKNQITKECYESAIFMNLIQCSMFFIIPLLVGLVNAYAVLSAAILLIILKIRFSSKILKIRPNLYQFVVFICQLLQLCLVACFFIAHLFSSFPDLSPVVEINWMTIIKYNSIALVFLYLSLGSIQIGIGIYDFFSGFLVLQFLCDRRSNKIENDNGSMNQIKVNQYLNENNVQQNCVTQQLEKTGIRVINQLKNNVEKSISDSKKSLEQIQNPFVKSTKTITFKEHQKKDEEISQKIEKKQKEQKKVKITKVITMKHIEPAEQLVPDEGKRGRTKSAYQKDSYQKELQQKQQQDDRTLKKQKRLMKQKSLKLIKRLQITIRKQDQPTDGPETFKNIVVSNFQKQQNFS